MRLCKICMTATLAAGTAVAAMIPAQSAPIARVPLHEKANTATDIIEVQNRVRRGRHDRRRFDERRGVYNGYRGSRHHRRGWRQHDGWWFPPAAFALGVIIGNQFQPRHSYRLPPAHYRWCDYRWRTYRHSDNTYVPRVGYRAECRSPYWP